MDGEVNVASEQAPLSKPVNAEALIELYLQIRDAKKVFEKQCEQTLSLYNDRMHKIETALHKFMESAKTNSLPTDKGTAYISAKNSASVADASAFRGHIIENRSWDLADWRANLTATEAYIKENGQTPPGVNYRSFETVNVRRPVKAV